MSTPLLQGIYERSELFSIEPESHETRTMLPSFSTELETKLKIIEKKTWQKRRWSSWRLRRVTSIQTLIDALSSHIVNIN